MRQALSWGVGAFAGSAQAGVGPVGILLRFGLVAALVSQGDQPGVAQGGENVRPRRRNPGVAASWSIFPDIGWVGVVLANYDTVPLQEILERQTQAVLGRR